MIDHYDYIIVGAGIGGLFTAALLANEGKKVCVLERHYALGGYAHSFHAKGISGKDYSFCCHVHYVFNCLDGNGAAFFRRLGLDKEVIFTPLDPNGFDRLHFPDFNYNIVKGFHRNLEVLVKEFPRHAKSLEKYFCLCKKITDQLLKLPLEPSYKDFLIHPLKYSLVIRYRKWTLQKLFEKLEFPLKLQAILAGQMGDIALPPKYVSLIIHAANTTMYDKGACKPTKGFEYLFNKIADSLLSKKGCRIRTLTEVGSFTVKNNRITGAVLSDGSVVTGDNYIFNGDPKMLRHMIGERNLPASFNNKLNYDYSFGSFVVYIGLKDIELNKYGFGNWNMWYYTGIDLNELWDNFFHNCDPVRTPMMFMSSSEDKIIVETGCTFEYFNNLRREIYEKEKKRVIDGILDRIEENCIPNIRNHIDYIEAGTPLTNQRFVHAPFGNVYGQNLSPENIKIGKIGCTTPFKNLYLIGATAGMPSFGGGLRCSMLLAEKLLRKNLH